MALAETQQSKYKGFSLLNALKYPFKRLLFAEIADQSANWRLAGFADENEGFS